jgi:hypothetical protein
VEPSSLEDVAVSPDAVVDIPLPEEEFDKGAHRYRHSLFHAVLRNFLIKKGRKNVMW